MARLVDAVAGLGVAVGAADIAMANLFLGVPISQVLEPTTTPAVVVQAWSDVMGKTSKLRDCDSLAVLLALATIANVLARGGSQLSLAVASRGWNLQRSTSEAALRLSGVEFNLGRRLLADRARRVAGRALLVEALATSSQVVVRAHSRDVQQRLFGMRATAYLLLARGEVAESRLPLLEASCSAFAQSRRLGDRSAQHSEHAIEALLRRNHLRPAESLLVEAETLLQVVGVGTRQLAEHAGDIASCRGQRFVAAGHHEQALDAYRRATAAYGAALSLPRREDDKADEELRAKRGYARLRAHHVSARLLVDVPNEELDGIIDDVECSEADPRTGLTPLPEALLCRAERYRAQGDLELAIRDLLRAIDVSPAESRHPEVIEFLTRAQSELSECQSERADRSLLAESFSSAG